MELNGKKEKVRLIGVDTPEMNIKTGDPQPYALESTLFTQEQAEGKTVRLSADPLDDDRDKYGRLLRYATLPNGNLLNLELVRRGYGFALLAFPFEWRDRFAEAEIEARREGRGLWAPGRIESIRYQDAPSREGRVVAARGRVVAAKTLDTRASGKLCFLNFHAIREADFRRFGGDPAARYQGRNVTVTGRVRNYRGRPQIEVIDPGQIEIDP